MCHCTVPYFGFKAKLITPNDTNQLIVLCLILDSRQNCECVFGDGDEIVLCLILDSRQNCGLAAVFARAIVLCLILDSRQN